MKKVLSVVLAVAALLTLAFSAMTVSAAGNGSLLPSKAEDFEVTPGGPNKTESMTVKAVGSSFEFTSEPGGWPQATYSIPAEADWVKADTNDANAYLNWDFEVKSGGANVIVYFAGQSPKDQPALGAAETINYYIDPQNNTLTSGQVKDLPVGKYKGSIHVKDTGISELLMEEGIYFISSVKVFAAGGTVVVNDISVGPKAEETTTTAKKADPATTTAAQTTTTGNVTTPSSAQTGDVSNAIVFIVVAAVAAGVVVMSVVSKKKKN